MRSLVMITIAAAVLVMQPMKIHAGVTVVDGSRFLNTHETPGVRLEIQGAALLRYLGFIRAYTGALYLPTEAAGHQALADIPKHLVLEYRVGITAEEFSKATEEKIRDAVDQQTYDRLLPKIEQLNRLYQDVSPGDRYALTYRPGKGTWLYLNDKPLGSVQGAEFARALFGIWIGDKPIDRRFRDRLLGIS